MSVALVAFAISAFDGLETSSDRTEVVNVVDYDSFELESVMAFSVSKPNNLSLSGEIGYVQTITLNGYISEVEAEERGSPEMSNYISNNILTKKDNLEMSRNYKYWGHRTNPGKFNHLI